MQGRALLFQKTFSKAASLKRASPCFSLPSLRWYNVIISSSTFQMPVNWSADHRPCWFLVCFLFLGVFVCFFGFGFLLFALFCFARWQLNGLCIDSVLLYAHCRHGWCCHCINSVNLQMQLSFRLDKWPGERWTEKNDKPSFSGKQPYAFCINTVVLFGRVGLCCWFCDWKWDRQAVPFLEPCLGGDRKGN